MSEAIAQKLDEARALIERGWCQGTFTLDGCFCLYGAVNMVVDGVPWSELTPDEYFVPLADVIGGEATEYNLASWNDAPERTQAEVIEAFRKAAELARSESPNA